MITGGKLPASPTENGQTHFFFLAQKETGLDPKEKRPVTRLLGVWSLSALTLSRIGLCPDRRYGGDLL